MLESILDTDINSLNKFRILEHSNLGRFENAYGIPRFKW